MKLSDHIKWKENKYKLKKFSELSLYGKKFATSGIIESIISTIFFFGLLYYHYILKKDSGLGIGVIVITGILTLISLLFWVQFIKDGWKFRIYY